MLLDHLLALEREAINLAGFEAGAGGVTSRNIHIASKGER